MDHVPVMKNTPQCAGRNLAMKLCRLFRFNQPVLAACNDRHRNIQLSINMAEPFGAGNVEPGLRRRCIGDEKAEPPFLLENPRTCALSAG